MIRTVLRGALRSALGLRSARQLSTTPALQAVRPLGPKCKVPDFEGTAVVDGDFKVVACSCDSHFSHLAWTQTPRKDGGLGDMDIPILADFNKKIARNFGVLDEEAGVSFRGLFLIDPEGVVRHTVCNDLPVGRSVDEALRTLKAFQYVEKHGEVCPADWHDDSPTIKPGVKDSKEYFNKVNK